MSVSTDPTTEPENIENAIFVLRLNRLSMLGLTQELALNLKKASLDGCGTAQSP